MDDALEEALALSTRDKIYASINKNPGLHFRELQRRTDIATGSLQYHLDYLMKKHLVRQVKEGKFTRFYSIRGQQIENPQLMNLLRQESVRRIVVFLMNRRFANNLTIAKEVGLSASTTSFHLQKLLSGEVIQTFQRGRKTYYKLSNKDAVAELLVGFKKSFLDDVVNNFVEIWEEV